MTRKKILLTPVTATWTGDEFYVRNNGDANQSKYPTELRARLNRQNSCMYNTLLTKYYTIGVCTAYEQSLVKHSNNGPSPLTQWLPHSAITTINNL